ncbi:heme ABC exporter ATP-binding protein CcmA [Anderseniella sp. Alg231-50]|uniref:heme ABC exporter ATP-binding protein CcmA n=1 Tax=Anderseniella sp. Alg231-50 TaxID=1922226 RepID=UPI000D557D11
MKIVGQQLACERGGRLVFAGLDFAASAGRMLVLRGPNGAGKTSLLRLVAGLAEPAGGSLALEQSTLPADALLGEHVHFIAHQDAIKLHLSVAENLNFWAGFFGGGDVAGAMTAMNLSALGEFQAQRLSAGQKRRLGLARLALVEKPVWLLDEPTVGLDTASQELLAGMMVRHLDAGGIIIASTHIELPVKSSDILDFANLPKRAG